MHCLASSPQNQTLNKLEDKSLHLLLFLTLEPQFIMKEYQSLLCPVSYFFEKMYYALWELNEEGDDAICSLKHLMMHGLMICICSLKQYGCACYYFQIWETHRHTHTRTHTHARAHAHARTHARTHTHTHTHTHAHTRTHTHTHTHTQREILDW